MGCPKCGKPVMPGASFCMHCGAPIAPAAAAKAPAPNNPAPKKLPKVSPAAAAGAGAGAATMQASAGIMSQAAFKARQDVTRRRAIIGGSSALVALLLCAVLVRATGLLNVGGHRAAAGDLEAQGMTPESMLKERGTDSPSMLKEGQKLVSMPDDVRDWLKHLQEVERRKRELTGDEMRELQLTIGQGNATEGLMTGDGVKEMADPDSNITAPPIVTQVEDMAGKFKKKWTELSDFLLSKPAPAECKPIEESYDKGLNQMALFIDDVQNMFQPVMDKAESDPGAAKQEGLDKANDIKNSHAKNVDKNFGDADDGVGQICSKYHVSKMFDIDRHGDGGSMLGAGG